MAAVGVTVAAVMSIMAFITDPPTAAIIIGPVAALMSITASQAGAMGISTVLIGPVAVLMSITAFLAGVMGITTAPTGPVMVGIITGLVAAVTTMTITSGGTIQAMPLAWRLASRLAWQSVLSCTPCHRTVCTRVMAAWRIADAATSGISRIMRIPKFTTSS
jgi:hypothetical protein